MPTARNYNVLCAPEILKKHFCSPPPRQHLSFCILYSVTWNRTKTFFQPGRIPVPFCRHSKDFKSSPSKCGSICLFTKQNNTIFASLLFALAAAEKGLLQTEQRLQIAAVVANNKRNHFSTFNHHHHHHHHNNCHVAFSAVTHFPASVVQPNRKHRRRKKRKEGSECFFCMQKNEEFF